MRREGKTIEYIALHLNRGRALIGEACRGHARVVQQQAQVVNIPASVLAEREARLALSPRDLTAAIAGDPLPGMSALERGQEKWEPVFRPAARQAKERGQRGTVTSTASSS